MIRVATAPENHPYLDAVLPSDVERVRWDAHAQAPFAVSRIFDLNAAQLASVDVCHLHFGYESMSIRALSEWADSVRGSTAALVVTVHDLRNPHEPTAGPHDARLAVLMAAADAVITLTEGSAAEIRRRWERTASVLPHPALAAPPRGDSERTARDTTSRPIVGIHLKSLRANIVQPSRIVRAAAAGARRCDAHLRVDVHAEVLDRFELADVRAAAESGELDLRVHDRFTDPELIDYLTALDVSVLPYRFGTHSGWLELCRDLGTAAAVPDCGYYAQQWDEAVLFSSNETSGLDEASLSDCIDRAVRLGAPPPADAGRRSRQRGQIRAAHAAVYSAAIAAAASRRDGNDWRAAG